MSGFAREVAFIGVLFVSIFSLVHADVVPFRPCPVEDPQAPVNCTINEVRINPCKEASQGKPCRFKRGINASLEFDYVANFAAPALEGRAFWVNSVMEVPFMGMEANACLGTSCPVTPGQVQTYHQEFPISKKYPVRTYDVKWAIVSPDEQQCCFIFQIKIHK
ncbi:MD-2-related lipid-recognition protein-like [Venturia canescens]|uniref:MD-2-related lipid-recognition protein-like n=1 Tax=Venturia canescens TaxID=32260 RepID=UPI001C9CD1AF|nr:MD-2-related lipid-recognition protein-like [Venturia canescens]